MGLVLAKHRRVCKDSSVAEGSLCRHVQASLNEVNQRSPYGFREATYRLIEPYYGI